MGHIQCADDYEIIHAHGHKWVMDGTYSHNEDDKEKAVFGIKFKCANGCATRKYFPVDSPYDGVQGVCAIFKTKGRLKD